MKKLLIVLLVCFLLVGCGTAKGEKNESVKNETVAPVKKESVLVCSKKSTASSIDFITEMSYLYEGDELVKLGVRYVYDLSQYTDEQRQAFANYKMCETEGAKDTLGLTDCQEKLEGTNYIVSGISEKFRQQSTGTLKEVHASYVKDGWECTTE